MECSVGLYRPLVNHKECIFLTGLYIYVGMIWGGLLTHLSNYVFDSSRVSYKNSDRLRFYNWV